MKRTIFIWLVFLIPFCVHGQTIYYVSLTGDDGHSGLSETAAWRTITYALSASSPVGPGDTVFVKAGNYGSENVVIEKTGTVSQPIVVQGYKEVPGDDPGFDFDYGDALDASYMPLLDGMDRSTGIAVDINGSKNIVIKNLQIKNYEFGIMDHSYTDDLNTRLDHIFVTDMGDILDSYSGKAIEFYASHNKINSCVVVNASAQGIYVEGDYNEIKNCKVYCDDNTSSEAAMDYYIVVYYGSHNVVRDCYVERIGDLPHVGHGIGMKGDCAYNQIISCTAKNFRGESFYVRHRGSKFNTFENCVAIGVTQETAGFVVRDGASDNQFNNCTVQGCKRGFMFHDSDEDGGTHYCGRHNVFNNCILTDVTLGIDFNDADPASQVDSNFFYNCVFYNGGTLVNVEINNFDNAMINCIVSGYQDLKAEFNGYTLSFDFEYCDFYDNAFPAPGGAGNISSNPMFVDGDSGDFHLQKESPCIDAGTADGAPGFDFDGTTRPQGSGYDLGAYEYLEPLAVAPAGLLTATAHRGFVELIWPYRGEMNGGYFLVQRTADVRGGYWADLMEVKDCDAVASRGFFRLQDTAPLPGISYYRLKYVDPAGGHIYSNIASVHLDDVGKRIFVSPNPVRDELIIRGAGLYRAIRIFDVSGRLIRSFRLPADGRVDVSFLPAGVYYLLFGGKFKPIRFSKTL